MIPTDISDTHITKAAKIIDREGIPDSRKSVHYDLILKGKKYPPKYVVSIAYRVATGSEYPPGMFNAVEAKNYFLARGYDLVDRRDNTLHRIESEDYESQYPEGKAKYRLHRKLERDPKLANAAKAKALEINKELKCEACGFDFFKIYGELGFGFIEAHHKIPVAILKGKKPTKISDLTLLCSNCHRMIHRGKRVMSVRELQKIIDEPRGV
jgi:ribosomal protein L44E